MTRGRDGIEAFLACHGMCVRESAAGKPGLTMHNRFRNAMKRAGRIIPALFVGLVAFALAGCGGDESVDASTERTTVSARLQRTVVGRVMSWERTPIAGARVQLDLPGGVRAATTDADGRFVFSKVPTDELPIRVEAEGHVVARQAVPSVPLDDALVDGMVSHAGIFGLIPTTGRFEVAIRSFDGRPLTPPRGWCKVDIGWIILDWNEPVGELRVDARTEDGRLVCEGLPDLRALLDYGIPVLVGFDPIDVDGDGEADYDGGQGTFSVYGYYVAGQVPTYTPSVRGEAFFITQSNAPGFMGRQVYERAFAPTEAVELHFNGPALIHRVWTEGVLGKEPPEVTYEVEGARMRILPVGGSWPEGRLFRIHLLAAPLSAPYWIRGWEGVVWIGSTQPLTAKATFVDADDDGVMGADEHFRIEFSEPLHAHGDAAFPGVSFQVNFDIDGSGLIGDFPGEDGTDAAYARAKIVPERLYENIGDAVIYPDPGPNTLPLRDGTEIILRFDLERLYGSSQENLLLEPLRLKLRAVRL